MKIKILTILSAFFTTCCIISLISLTGCTKSEKEPDADYVIIREGNFFTARKRSATGKVVGTANKPIGYIIDFIKRDANGKDCAIQFGDGKYVLNLGNNYIEFNGGESGKDWGKITLLGKVTSRYVNNEDSYGTINLVDGLIVDSWADIENTGFYGIAIIVYNTKYDVTLNIIDGTVKVVSDIPENGVEIYTVTGWAILETSEEESDVVNTINIKGGKIESDCYCGRAIWSQDGIININGGIIKASYHYDNIIKDEVAIYKFGIGEVNIRGGNISTNLGYDNGGSIAVYNYASATINISGGTVIGYPAIYNDLRIQQDGGGIVNITGGKISSKSGNYSAIYNYNFISPYYYGKENSIILSGNPDIFGSIHSYDINYAGLSVVDNFNPQKRIYELSYFFSFPNKEEEIAVLNGAKFISNFKLHDYQDTTNTLFASGNDIMVKRKPESMQLLQKKQILREFDEKPKDLPKRSKDKKSGIWATAGNMELLK